MRKMYIQYTYVCTMPSRNPIGTHTKRHIDSKVKRKPHRLIDRQISKQTTRNRIGNKCVDRQTDIHTDMKRGWTKWEEWGSHCRDLFSLEKVPKCDTIIRSSPFSFSDDFLAINFHICSNRCHSSMQNMTLLWHRDQGPNIPKIDKANQ